MSDDVVGSDEDPAQSAHIPIAPSLDALSTNGNSAQLADEGRISAPLSTETPQNTSSQTSQVPPRAVPSPDLEFTTAPPDFAPYDLRDGRHAFEWSSRYSDEPRNRILEESAYLIAVLYFCPLAMVIIWAICPPDHRSLARFAYAWLGGMLGGTIFDLKWLYHSVAKGLWHLDRRLWRFLTPHISGALAFSFTVLISSNLINIFKKETFDSSIAVVGIAFLVGYFSDSAIAKLTELAETLFGTSRTPEDPPRQAPSA